MGTEYGKRVKNILKTEYRTNLEEADTTTFYNAVSLAAMAEVPAWEQTFRKRKGPQVAYFSAEFLMGRLVYSNLFNLGLLQEYQQLCKEGKRDPSELEEIPDDALGNGGLGRLAACFLDSGATNEIHLDGYGIRYRYGLFRQTFRDGFQQEEPDDWQRVGDPWSVRKEKEKVLISFRGQKVWAVPYDMPIFGYGNGKVNRLRLWQAEPLEPFNFQWFNEQKYEKAVRERDRAEAISMVLYPNDENDAGKKLRIKQEYFFSAASIQDMIRTMKEKGKKLIEFPACYRVQLNDTHPVMAVLEFLRILWEEEKMDWQEAFSLAEETFAYTNHTIMAEALETWDMGLLESTVPQVCRVIKKLQEQVELVMKEKGTRKKERKEYDIILDNRVQMARIAIFAGHSVNGVAKIHSEILKEKALKYWYQWYPERFGNKTNGITQRRWLGLCNPELSRFITGHIGTGWLTDLDQLKQMERYQDHHDVLEQFHQVKQEKKKQLAAYVKEKEGITVNPQWIFDIQVKRLHEYKRQLLNAFGILDLYYGIKEGRLPQFYPTVFFFGAKAAPGYYRAKGIIKYIQELAKKVNEDPETKDKLQVVFVTDYNVSYAEKLIPAADVSQQISTAGTEASGTGNMKFMLNGAVTLGTFDGANVEIVEQAGLKNNYIFGARVEQLDALGKRYRPMDYCQREPRIARVVNSLTDGTFQDGGTGMFRELRDSLLTGASWHRPDAYYLLLDFLPYVATREKVNRDYSKREAFDRRCFCNMANAGKFSSDRTIREYSQDIWNVE